MSCPTAALAFAPHCGTPAAARHARSLARRMIAIVLAAAAFALAVHGEVWVLQQAPDVVGEMTVGTCLADAVHIDTGLIGACAPTPTNNDKDLP